MTTTWRKGSLRRSLVAVVLSASMLSVLTITNTTPTAAAPIALDQGGEWGPVEAWPMVGIHAALDRNGNVVTYGTNGDATQTGRFIYDIWTPGPSAAAGHNTLTNTTQTDIFCSLQLNRADTGDMLLFGGDNWTGANTNNLGNPAMTWPVITVPQTSTTAFCIQRLDTVFGELSGIRERPTAHGVTNTAIYFL